MSGSCALNLCGVACGRIDIFFETGFGGPWYDIYKLSVHCSSKTSHLHHFTNYSGMSLVVLLLSRKLVDSCLIRK